MLIQKKDKNIVGIYRIQLTSEFGFQECSEIVTYLHKLGISHIYFSPYFQAEAGSTSGYDVINHHQINDELGGEKGLQLLLQKMKPVMGQILDIVPNHVSIRTDHNILWMDVLKNGPKSKYAKYFDINWNPPQKKLTNKILLPVLGEHYKNELHNRKIQIKQVNGDFLVTYYSSAFPLNSESVKKIKKKTAKETDEELFKINNDFSRLDEILNMQFYFFSHWEAADKEINYRRFFSINHLLGLRIEEPAVFEHIHKLVFKMQQKGELDGLRIDHIDGLAYPVRYLNNLRKRAPDTWVVVEKILGSEESIPSDWPVQGTTGYDFLNVVNGLFVNPSAKESLANLYEQITGESREFKDVLYEKKLLMIKTSFQSEASRLMKMIEEISMNHREYRDLTINELSEGLFSIIASFPVYRTYIDNLDEPVSLRDKKYIEHAISDSMQRNPKVHVIVWDFYNDLFNAKIKGEKELEFILRFQQLTGPIMAKGAEDTAFYNHNTLISLNEVGGDPSIFGTPVKNFHDFCKKIQKKWPLTINTTSTHDTKRGEDVRMRINMISEIPQQWEETVKQWLKNNAKYRKNNMPLPNNEYLLYQTLVGSWPIEKQRINDIIIKALREEKVHSNWTDINKDYEQSIINFSNCILNDKKFISSLESFIQLIIKAAQISSLALTLIKYMSPGIPDLYQGTELWDLNLVDPDNRRLVDYEFRKKIFSSMEKMTAQDSLKYLDSGLTKMFVIHKCLKIRAQYQECFGIASNYKQIKFTGTKIEHLIGFMRADKIITIAPRLLISLGNRWQDTAAVLPAGKWKNLFTDQYFNGEIMIKNLFNNFPLALLIKE